MNSNESFNQSMIKSVTIMPSLNAAPRVHQTVFELCNTFETAIGKFILLTKIDDRNIIIHQLSEVGGISALIFDRSFSIKEAEETHTTLIRKMKSNPHWYRLHHGYSLSFLKKKIRRLFDRIEIENSNNDRFVHHLPYQEEMPLSDFIRTSVGCFTVQTQIRNILGPDGITCLLWVSKLPNSLAFSRSKRPINGCYPIAILFGQSQPEHAVGKHLDLVDRLANQTAKMLSVHDCFNRIRKNSLTPPIKC